MLTSFAVLFMMVKSSVQALWREVVLGWLGKEDVLPVSTSFLKMFPGGRRV